MNVTAGSSIERFAQEGELIETVIRTVADAVDSDPLELSPLYEVIDPDALGLLFRPQSNGHGSVSFSWEGCSVTVESDGHVVVTTANEQ